jgi:protein-histidine N-methyltransferase
MAFSFGFSGDDIEEDPNDLVPETQSSVANDDGTSTQPPPIPAKAHDLDELVGRDYPKHT